MNNIYIFIYLNIEYIKILYIYFILKLFSNIYIF